MRLATCFLASLPLFLAACSGDDGASSTGAGSAPADVAHAFFSAARDGDTRGFEALLTEKARLGLGSDGGGFQLEDNLQSFEIGDAVVDGTTAVVPALATIREEQQHIGICLRLENNAWRIWGFEASIGGEASMTIDLESMGEMMNAMQTGLETAFEGAFEDMSMGGSAEEIREAHARFDAVASVAEPQHEAAWRVDVAADGLPALDVLSKLFDGTEVALEAGAHADTLAKPISLELSGVSRLEAVERICDAAELHPVYPDLGWTNDDSGPSVSFGAGPRPFPVTFAGPFLIEVANLEENAPNTTGAITLAVRALGLESGVLAFQTEMVETLAVAAIQNATGESVNANEDTTFYGTPQVDKALFGDSTSFSLRSLLRGVEEIHVQGSVRLRIPSWVVATRVEAGGAATKSVGDLLVTRKEWGESTSFEITGAPDADAVSVQLAPEGGDGEPMGSIYSDSNSWGDVVNASLQTPETPSAVDLKICTVTEVEYTFELEGIPLARSAEQPEHITPLTFPGEAPITIDFVRFVERGDFPKVELRVSNVSNKVTQSVSTTFVYLSAAGKEIETFPHLLSGEFDFEGQHPLADEGATVTHETQAAFAPANTASIRVRIDEVTFFDASDWAPED